MKVNTDSFCTGNDIHNHLTMHFCGYIKHSSMCFIPICHHVIIIIMYLYSAQYIHILQDSKRYLTNPTVQVQPQLTSN